MAGSQAPQWYTGIMSKRNELPESWAHLWTGDLEAQGLAYATILECTNQPVRWAYAVWDELVNRLRDENNRSRSIASQILCNLAKSDPEDRILRDLPALIEVTRDERFVTARHCLQSLWKVGAEGGRHQEALVDALQARFEECRGEKNWSLIRYDIVVSLRKVFESTGDEAVRSAALDLIDREEDPKYRKKYAKEWK